MSSVDDNFQELMLRLDQGRHLDNTGDDPVYYLVFPPSQMLDVKRKMKSWLVKLEHRGWHPHVMSMAETIHEILQNHDLREDWLEAEADCAMDFDLINQTMEEALNEDDILLNKLKDKLTELEQTEKAVLLLTDIEALHPYLRIGYLEQRLTNKFKVPAVIFYPGKRSGKYNLSFLGIYPEDGNYRSVHIGG
jgi:hypothetical protein